MMSAQGGGRGSPKADAVRKLLREVARKCRQEGEGVKKSDDFADIIGTCPMPAKQTVLTKKRSHLSSILNI